MTWLLNNKQWLFSGAGVVVFIAAWNSLCSLFSKAPPPTPANAPLNAPPEEKFDPIPDPVQTPTSNITPKSIITTVERAPLLQQPDIQKQFLGVVVTWDGILATATKESGGKVRLMISVDDKPFQRPYHCVFTVSSKKYPGLGLLTSDHKIRVTGRISTVSSYIRLDNAKIEFEIPSQDPE